MARGRVSYSKSRGIELWSAQSCCVKVLTSGEQGNIVAKTEPCKRVRGSYHEATGETITNPAWGEARVTSLQVKPGNLGYDIEPFQGGV